jgi:hypothetical protein
VDVLARKTVPVGPEHESLGNARVFRIETREIGDRWWRIRPWLRMRQWGDIYEAFLEDRQYDGAIVFQPEAAHYLRRRRPRLPILIATGGTWQGSKEYYFSSRNSTLLARLTGELRYRQYRRYEVLGNYAATFVIAESRNVHEQLVRWYALPPERVRIIGNGRDPQRKLS